MKTFEIFCGNFGCPTRRDGRMFRVVDTDGMSAGERALLVKPGAKTEADLIDGIDGVITDGETWVCPDCRGTA